MFYLNTSYWFCGLKPDLHILDIDKVSLFVSVADSSTKRNLNCDAGDEEGSVTSLSSVPTTKGVKVDHQSPHDGSVVSIDASSPRSKPSSPAIDINKVTNFHYYDIITIRLVVNKPNMRNVLNKVYLCQKSLHFHPL